MLSRSDLNHLFKDGKPLNTKTYGQLIDSIVNIIDDGILVDKENGLELRSKGRDEKLISFIQDNEEAWNLNLFADRKSGLHFSNNGTTKIFINPEGKMGIGTIKPISHLSVEGTMAVEGIMGTYGSSKVNADGKWHTILRYLQPCQGFELTADIREGDEYRYGLTHAILLLAGGKKGKKKKIIRPRQNSLWKGLFKKIQFRWVQHVDPDPDGNPLYKLQIRSRIRIKSKVNNNNYGVIFFRILKIWDKNYDLKAGDGTYKDVQKPEDRRM